MQAVDAFVRMDNLPKEARVNGRLAFDGIECICAA